MRIARIECDKDLYNKIFATLQNAITGKPIFYGDSLVDLVRRHCPELYDMARAEGFAFVPSPDSEPLGKKEPEIPEIWFDVVRSPAPH